MFQIIKQKPKWPIQDGGNVLRRHFYGFVRTMPSLKQTVILSEESRFSVLWLRISPLKISLRTSVPACKTPPRKRQRGLAIPAPIAAFVSFVQPVEETEVIEATVTEDIV